MMPRLSGFEVCRKLRANPATKDLLILMVTALNEASDFERGVQAGTDDFLTKPVNKVELLCRIRSLLRVRHLKNQLDRTLAYLAEFESTSRRPRTARELTAKPISWELLRELRDQPAHESPRGRVVLKPRRARPFFARHPWVFTHSVARVEGAPAPGDEVEVFSHEGLFIARGLYNPGEHAPGAALPLGRRAARRRILARQARGRPSACGSTILGLGGRGRTRTGSSSARGTASRA